MNLRKGTKSYPITKEQVWEAFKLVRSNKGSMGVDGISIETIRQQPQKYLYPLWNRMASGSYFPPPVKRVEIPKDNGKKRALGIPTVTDRVAQMVIAKELERIVEPHFSENSFGYRPNKSAHQAIEQARKNCWNYAWVIDLDIQGFFDSIDHGLMIRALRYFTNERHIITYCKRWLKAPIQQKDGTLIPNEERGTPQGGVVSPVLANIFLHVVFDKWIEQKFADCPFERYADDIIIHVKNEVYAKQVLKAVKERFEQCKLTLHHDKTKLVYCNRKGRKKRKKTDHQQFDFLGFTFRPRQVQTKTGELVFGFSPSISRKSIKRIVRECLKLGFHRWIHMDFHQMANALSSKIRGWINYYGKFHISALKEVFRHLNERLVKWIFNKYKRFKRFKTHFFAKQWLRKISNDFEYLFPHWKYGFKP